MQYKLYRVIIMMYICIVSVLSDNILYGDETIVLPTHHENSSSNNKISSKKYLYKAICLGAVCLSSVGALAGSIFSEVLPENLTLPTSTSYPTEKFESLVNYNEYKLIYSKRAFLVNSLVQECEQIDRLIKDALENELRSEEEKEKFWRIFQI